MLANRLFFSIAFATLALLTSVGVSQSTQPSDTANPITTAELQVRANALLAGGNYSAALPLLERAESELSGQPDQLGPLLEQIRFCRKQIELAATTQPVQAAVIPSPSIETDQRKPHPALAPGQTLEIAIKDLGNFDYDSINGGNIPDDVKKLDGSAIRTQGFMIPLDQSDTITQFALVPSLTNCCSGQPPQIQHTIVVHCPKGKTIAYCTDALTVEGTLHIFEEKDGGFIVSIFQIDATSIRPVSE
jgi:hypothetical protein